MTDDDPVTLAEAAKHFRIGVEVLRVEHARGNLVLYKPGGRYWTTLNNVRDMFERCRVKPKAPASITRKDVIPGLSAMDRRSSALATLNKKLSEPSPNTSARNTNRSNQNVHS
jgi:hypothetical protein